MERTFTIVNDEVLIQAMKAARRKLVYVAPGITARVAQALVQQCKEHITVSVIVILDIDPEVYRLGYGEVAGLEQLQQYAADSGFEVRHQPGVRIGLLISDDNILIYSPTPLLIEAGSEQPEKPNALCLQDISLPQIERACGSADASLQASSEIGTTPVEDTLIESVKKDLTDNPPKRFDIARAERVFNSRIQYVEFSLETYRHLLKKSAPIPSDLMGLANMQELQNRWRNTFKLFDARRSFDCRHS